MWDTYSINKGAAFLAQSSLTRVYGCRHVSALEAHSHSALCAFKELVNGERRTGGGRGETEDRTNAMRMRMSADDLSK